jgi:hypothetical protein
VDNTARNGNLTLSCGNRIALSSLNKNLVRNVNLSVTLGGTVSKKEYMWIWIKSEPTNFTVDEGLKRVTGFTAVDSHVYDTDNAGSLSGDYTIMLGTLNRERLRSPTPSCSSRPSWCKSGRRVRR